MGLLEPFTHKEEIEQLLNEAEQIYNKAVDNMEKQKRLTTNSLENLGSIKIHAWSYGMGPFADTFESFKNIEMDQKLSMDLYFRGSGETPERMLININDATVTANEIAHAGLAAVGTGAVIGIAAYGGAMMFAKASTGTAIAALSGVAKTNATLAWFGGGSIAAGGLGVKVGKLVLSGVVIAPILLIGGAILSAKGHARLEEAREINAEARDKAATLKTVTAGMAGIEKMSNHYADFINQFDNLFAKFVNELNRIKDKYKEQMDFQGRIPFESLNSTEQKTLHITWLLAQIYYSVLSATILTADGDISQDAVHALRAAKSKLKNVRRETFVLSGRDGRIGNLVWQDEADKMKKYGFFVTAVMVLIGVVGYNMNLILCVAGIISAAVAFPIFFKYKNLPASRYYALRIARMIAAIGIMVTTLVGLFI